jgi:CheY-like chemotaxis protein
VQQRVFEPFFTTKDRSRGTGLGLASSYGIVVNHGGTIEVFSKKNVGSTFVVYLPATRKPVNAQPVDDRRMVGGQETILVVDDEANIIEVTRGMLRRLGYNVMAARSGAEAVEVFREHRDRIDIVILDLVMPTMDGAKTYEAIKLIKPGVRVLLSSGYSLAGDAGELVAQGCDGFIQKPFNIQQLSEKLNQVLGSPTARTG